MKDTVDAVLHFKIVEREGSLGVVCLLCLLCLLVNKPKF